MVIARFSWIKVGLVLGLLLPMTGFWLYMYYQNDTHNSVFWLDLVCSPFLARYSFSLLNALFFHRARAMWIEDRQLIFVPYGLPASFTSFLYRVPVKDIASVTVDRLYTGSFIRPRGIVVDRKSRGFGKPYGEAPAQLYSEPVEVVRDRLCEVLGIKPPSVASGEIPAMTDGLRKT